MSARAAQAIAEGISGMRFGSAVGTIANPTGDVRRINYIGGVYEIGDLVRLIGGGVTATPFTITNAGYTDPSYWIEVESAPVIAPTKLLPVVEHEGEAICLHLHCEPKPIFGIVDVKTRVSDEAMWSDADRVTTLESTQYEVFKTAGLRCGVRLQKSAIPMVAEGGEYLVKRMVRQKLDGIKVTYAAGFYPHLPPDLEEALSQLEAAITASAAAGGVFASESLDYYSYSSLSYEQLAVMPHAAMSILRRYARI